MSSTNPAGGYNRTVTAFFDTRDAAVRAADQLAALGIPRDRVQIKEGGGQKASAQPVENKGFWEELKELFLPAEDRYSYAEGLSRGGYLLYAHVDDAHYNRALEVLDTEGAVNMDERESNWRASGWAGYPSQPSTAQTSTARADATAARTSQTAPRAGTAASQTTSTRATELQSGRDETIPVYEETANIGKRDVSHGRVRLRSYVVETPVKEQVNLRNERVEVERRPVDRPVAAGDAAFKDRVIEAQERVEEPVVTKETRVKEEVGLRKTAQNQTQTVTDTVRRTQVEVEDERRGAAPARAASASTSHIVDHMDVIAADGAKIGAVDHLEGDRIKLAKSASPDGQHHFIPLAWVDHVDSHVHLSKSAAETRANW